MFDSIKELAIDALVVVAAWVVVTAANVIQSAKGMSCGRAGEAAQVQKP